MNRTEERKKPGKSILITAVLLIIGLYFFVVGLIEASGFLGPLALAVILTMVLIPLSNKFENWGMSRGISTLISVLLTFSAVVLIFGLLAVQVNSIAQDWEEVKENVRPGIEAVQEKVAEVTGASPDEQKLFLEDNIPFLGNDKGSSQSESQQPEGNSEANNNGESGSQAGDGATGTESEDESDGGGGDTSGTINTVMGALVGFVSGAANFLLVFVYVFFMLLYRKKLKLSFLKFFSSEKREEAETVMLESIQVAEQYLVGRVLLILFLAVFYGIGFVILGMKSAILIAIFAALLSLLPYIGNIIAFFLAIALAAFSGGELGMYIGVVIIFGVAQFVESYILEPYLVGDKVDLNPFLTIIVVVIGGVIWGPMGMIISIPIFGIIKIIADHVPGLHPIGYTLGVEDVGDDGDGGDSAYDKMVNKLKHKMKEMRSKSK